MFVSYFCPELLVADLYRFYSDSLPPVVSLLLSESLFFGVEESH